MALGLALGAYLIYVHTLTANGSQTTDYPAEIFGIQLEFIASVSPRLLTLLTLFCDLGSIDQLGTST
jgi:hypothetical protein